MRIIELPFGTELFVTAAMIANMLGGVKVLKIGVSSELDLAELIRRGLPAASLDHMLHELAPSAESTGELYRLVGSMRTLQRKRTAKHRLSVDESDRLARVARVVVRAEEAIGDSGKARAWLGRPNRALAGQRPLSLLDSDAGTHAVERELGRIEHGVFS